MLAFNRLRVDVGEGYVLDYRFEGDRVESRILENDPDISDTIHQRWERLTAAELSSHVLADTVVARWLSRRMGVQRLLRACEQDTSFASGDGWEWLDRPAA